MLTKQEIFNKAWDRSVVRNLGKSENSTGCLYLNPETGRLADGCHIGILMSEAVYDKTLEELTVYGMEDALKDLPENPDRVQFRELLGTHPTKFWKGLQNTHDLFEGCLQSRLEDFAKEWKLEIPGH